MELLKELRNRTGAPIVDCKKAIQAAQTEVTAQTTHTKIIDDDDLLLPRALDWLRSHGAAKASHKVAGRTTTQGLVGLQISSDATTAALVKVASETDFAALSNTFVQLVQTIVQTTLRWEPSCSSSSSTTTTSSTSTPPLREMILQQPVVTAVAVEDSIVSSSSSSSSTNTTIQDCLNDAIVSIRENISIAEAIHLPNITTTTTTTTNASHDGIYVGYVHNKVDPILPVTATAAASSNHTIMEVSAGTAAAIVLLIPNTNTTTTTTTTREDLQHIGKLLAMHIVAAKPQYMSIADIPLDVVEKERDMIVQQLHNDPNNTKKPPHILEMILQGKLQKYYESIVLLEQSHMIVEDQPKIQSYLQQHQLSLQRYEYIAI